MHQLKPMIQCAEQMLSAAKMDLTQVESILADSGYWTPQSIEQAVEHLKTTNPQGEVLVAVPSRWKKFERPTVDGPAPPGLSVLEQVEYRTKSPAGSQLYQKRAQSIEPTFGQIKSGRGIRQLLLRGMQAANAEWKLITMTHNLLKLWRAKCKAGLQLSSYARHPVCL